MHLVGPLRLLFILLLSSSVDFVRVRRLCCVHPITCVDPVNRVVVLVRKRSSPFVERFFKKRISPTKQHRSISGTEVPSPILRLGVVPCSFLMLRWGFPPSQKLFSFPLKKIFSLVSGFLSVFLKFSSMLML